MREILTASTKKSIYINRPLDAILASFLSGDLIIQESKMQVVVRGIFNRMWSR